MLLGIVLGSVSFTGSLVAFGKLQGLDQRKAVALAVAENRSTRSCSLAILACGWRVGGRSATSHAVDCRSCRAGAVAGRFASAAHRRRGHAGGHFRLELLHRPGGGGDRFCHAQHVDDHRRHAGRRGGFVADRAHVQGDEPFAGQGDLWFVRPRAQRGGGRRARAIRPCAKSPPPNAPS